jgi:hypothetical protein
VLIFIGLNEKSHLHLHTATIFVLFGGYIAFKKKKEVSVEKGYVKGVNA